MAKMGERVPPVAEQRKVEETGCEVICGAPATLAVKGQVKGEGNGYRVMLPGLCVLNGHCAVLPVV